MDGTQPALVRGHPSCNGLDILSNKMQLTLTQKGPTYRSSRFEHNMHVLSPEIMTYIVEVALFSLVHLSTISVSALYWWLYIFIHIICNIKRGLTHVHEVASSLGKLKTGSGWGQGYAWKAVVLPSHPLCWCICGGFILLCSKVLCLDCSTEESTDTAKRPRKDHSNRKSQQIL